MNYTAIIISEMNFLKNMLGFPKDIKERIRNFKAKGTYFEVIKDTRNVKIKDCIITFSQAEEGKTVIEFHDKEAVTKQTINSGMNPVTFSIQKEGKSHACFEWQLEKETLHAGCYMDVESKKEFKDILCLVLKEISKDEHVKDHESLCKELSGIPIYKKEKQSKISTISAYREKLNNVLIAEAQKNENKMVHTCNYYEIELRERKVINEEAIFVLKSLGNYEFSFEIIDNSGVVILTKAVDNYLNYQINLDGGYIRWIDIDRNCAIVEANFEGRKDAALSLKYNMLEVMYEIKEKRKIDEEINAEEIAYIRKVNEEKPFEEKANSKIIEIYEQRQTIEEISEESYMYEDADRQKGTTYNNVCQSKVNNFSIAALGSLMETLQIGEDSHIKQSDKQILVDKQGKQVDIGEIILHESDTKALIRGRNGKLYYQDLQKSTVIEQFAPNSGKGIVTICPEFKEMGSSFKTFKAIGEKTIYEIDPRLKDGVGNMKDYSANNQFISLASTGKGQYVTGANNGEIRFYNQIGKNANNKFTSAGDAVISLDTTKDGKWILATFRRFLRLIPTVNDDETSLFQTKIPFTDRPTPIKLQISLEDLQKYGIKDFKFLPAKFDENKESVERFIVSGFGEYTVVWTLGKAIKGDRSYVVSKNEGTVVQADFRFNDPTRLLMTTSEGLLIRENKIKK